MSLLLPILLVYIVQSSKWANPCQNGALPVATYMYDAGRHDSNLCLSQQCYDENTFYIDRQSQGYASTIPSSSADLALTLWYSPTYNDNYVATTAGPPDSTYDVSFGNGYIYSKNVQGTVPLNLYYNSDYKDHATLANKTLEQQYINNGYKFIGTQGYIIGVDVNTSNVNTNPAPYCDVNESFEDRAKNLVYDIEYYNTVFLETYQGLSGNSASAIIANNSDIAVNIPAYQWWNEALHGVGNSPGVNYNGPIKATTMFPQVITTACSFNRSLFYRIGEAIGTEARAMWNNGQAGLTFWTPNINIFRDPRWGRGQETPGEDPFLNEQYAGHFVRGIQGNDDTYLKASSCCKHFADYSMEDSEGSDRYSFNALVSEYDQNDTYLVAFRGCIVDGNVSGIMCSYNAENGIPSCANGGLMTKYLREELGFYGYITSDDEAVSCVQNDHHYTNTTGETIQAVFKAGMDSNCGEYTQSYLLNAVETGAADLEYIQAGIYRSTLVQMRLGLFDPQPTLPWYNLGPNDVCTNESLALSHEASQQGIVLLKNVNDTLPLNNYRGIKIALIGPNANNEKVMKGSYYGDPPFVYSVYEGLSEYVESKNINYVKGCDINTQFTNQFSQAINAAQSADVVIMVMGLDQQQESEGNDRVNIDLPGQQNNLIGNITSNVNKPIILVFINGGSVDISKWRDSNNINGILAAGYPGMYGGLAISDIIFGTFNPTGLLDQTWYYANYINEVQMNNMGMRPNKTNGQYGPNPGRGYRYYNGSVVYPFGYGLSYTTFTCSNLNVNGDVISLNIKNTGTTNGGAVILIYWIPNNAGINGIELKRLIGFERVNMLNTGESTTINAKMFQQFYYNEYNPNSGTFTMSGACKA